MFIAYKKKDRNRVRIVYPLTLVAIALFTAGTLLLPEYDLSFWDILLSILFGISLMILVSQWSNRKSIKGLSLALQKNMVEMNSSDLKEELDLLEEFCEKNKKYKDIFAIPLFSGRRILGQFDEKYLNNAKALMKKKKQTEMFKANFTIELLYYYLSTKEVGMFMMGVKKLKSYHYTTYDKFYRMIKKHNKGFIINDREHKELALIGKMYNTGPYEEEIDKLLSTDIPYYKMLYTFYVMNMYEHFGNTEMKEKYQKELNKFEGSSWPLQGSEVDDFSNF